MARSARPDSPARQPAPITLLCARYKSCARRSDPVRRWGVLAHRGVAVYEIAGLNRTLQRANATEVGRRMKKSLARAQSPAFARESGRTSLLPCKIQKNLVYTHS